MRFIAFPRDASERGGAAVCVTAIVMLWVLSCAGSRVGEPGSGVQIHVAEGASDRPCAWFADARDGVLYFGQASFWQNFRRSGGNPRADLETAGALRVGRFDLIREQFLEPLEAGAGTASGTWDVYAHPNGRVYFSTFFDAAGFVEPASGRAVRFDALGTGLNELAAGPDDDLMATRYASEDGGSGSVVRFGPDGLIRAEFPLTAAAGERVLAKSLSFDPVRRTIWVNTDRIDSDGETIGHDARILDAEGGEERLRIEQPELHFVHFDARGRGVLAWGDGKRLTLRLVEPGGATGPDSGREIVLDRNFDAMHDFVQEARTTADGGALVTRWSGVIQRVDARGEVRLLRLPRNGDGGLYYSAFESDGRVCTTYCAGVRIVCAPSP